MTGAVAALMAAMMSEGAGGIVTLSGENIETSEDLGPVAARLWINADGTLDKEESGVRTQIDSGTDWIIPNAAASSLYEVRFTNLAGSIQAGSTDLTEDVWQSINADFRISTFRSGASGNGQTVATFDLQIRFNGGPVLATGFFTLTAEIF